MATWLGSQWIPCISLCCHFHQGPSRWILSQELPLFLVLSCLEIITRNHVASAQSPPPKSPESWECRQNLRTPQDWPQAPHTHGPHLSLTTLARLLLPKYLCRFPPGAGCLVFQLETVSWAFMSLIAFDSLGLSLHASLPGAIPGGPS
jgi:hypothetical protein